MRTWREIAHGHVDLAGLRQHHRRHDVISLHGCRPERLKVSIDVLMIGKLRDGLGGIERMALRGLLLYAAESLLQDRHASVRFVVLIVARKGGVSLLLRVEDMIGLCDWPVLRLANELDAA